MTSLKEGSDKGGLRGWFEGGGWDRYDSKGNKIGKCGGRKPGEAKPKCFSKEKAAALGKKGRAQAVRRKRREDPNPNRRGKPIDTPSTKKGLKRRESMSDFTDSIVKKLQEKTKKDACYHKVKASAKVWPSAYASGRLVQCRKKGASNYGKSNSSTEILGKAIVEMIKTRKKGGEAAPPKPKVGGGSAPTNIATLKGVQPGGPGAHGRMRRMKANPPPRPNMVLTSGGYKDQGQTHTSISRARPSDAPQFKRKKNDSTYRSFEVLEGLQES
jgi:hypothetical protein